MLLSNKEGSTSDVMNITGKLLAVLYNQPYTLPVKRKPVALNEEVLKKYVGTYEIAEIQLVVFITINNGLLTAQPYKKTSPGNTSILQAIDSVHFYDTRDEETTIMFEIDSTGKVAGVNITQRGITRFARKIK